MQKSQMLQIQKNRNMQNTIEKIKKEGKVCKKYKKIGEEKYRLKAEI